MCVYVVIVVLAYMCLYGKVCWKFEEKSCSHESTSSLFWERYVVGIDLYQVMGSLPALYFMGMIESFKT